MRCLSSFIIYPIPSFHLWDESLDWNIVLDKSKVNETRFTKILYEEATLRAVFVKLLEASAEIMVITTEFVTYLLQTFALYKLAVKIL